MLSCPCSGPQRFLECSNQSNADLNGKEQTLQVTAYRDDNPLLKHGFVQASPSKAYFEHAGVEGDHGNWGAWGRQPYDWTTWKQGMNYPGSTQLGLGRKLLEQYPWTRFEVHPEWAPGCFAAGIPGEVRFVYLPRRNRYNWNGPEVKGLEPDMDWHVYYFDPATGRSFDQGMIKATAKAGDAAAKPVSFRQNVPSPQD